MRASDARPVKALKKKRAAADGMSAAKACSITIRELKRAPEYASRWQ